MVSDRPSRRIMAMYVGAPGTVRKVAAAGFIDMVGAGLHLSTLPLFLTAFGGVSPTQIGVVVGTAAVVGLPAPYFAGRLTDRVGTLPVWRLMVMLRMVGYGLFALVNAFWPYFALAVLLEPMDRISANTQVTYLVRRFPPAERNSTLAAVRTSRSAGLGLGLLASTIIIGSGARAAFQIGFVLNALSFAVYLMLLLSLEPSPSPPSSPSPPDDEADRGVGDPWRDRRYLSLMLGQTLMSVHSTVLFVVLPLWVKAQSEIATALTGPLLALNAVLTMAVQAPLARLCTGLSLARRSISWSGVALVCSGVLFWGASLIHRTVMATVLAVLAVLMLTVGENIQAAAAFEASHRLAPERAMGRYLGAFSGTTSAQRIVGPPLLTGILVGTAGGWWAFAAVTVAGAMLLRRAMSDHSQQT